MAESHGGYLRYLSWVAAIFLGLYLLPYVVLRMDWCEWWTLGNHGSSTFSYTVKGLDADVVILGESSSYHGIDPNLISTTLGIKAVNLPNSIGSLAATDDLSLQAYLKNNRQPKVIVFYLAPWNLNYRHTKHFLTGLLDGQKMLLLYQPFPVLYRHAVAYKSDVFRFPFRFYSERSLSTLISEIGNRTPPNTVTNVPVDLVSYPHRLAAGCKLPYGFIQEGPAMDSARALLDRYSRSGSRVLVFLAPIPGCEGIGELLSRPFGKVGAAPPKVMAPQDFGDDGYYVHVDATVVPETTKSLIDAIRPLLGASEGNK